MAPEREIIEVRIGGARAEPSAIAFSPGVATQPFSVGTAAQWSVAANHVGPVHLFLGFDGQRVLVVAATPHLPVFLLGSRIGGSWVAASVPCEVRFGDACLMVRRAPMSAAPQNPAAFPTTVSDGGALWQAAQQAVHAARAVAPSSPPAGGPAHFGSTRLIERQPTPPAARLAPQRPAPPPKLAPPRSGALRAYWRSASTVKKITLALMPFSVAFGYFIFQPDPPRTPRRGQSHAADAAQAPSKNPASPIAMAGSTAPFADSGRVPAAHAAPAAESSSAHATAPEAPSLPESTPPRAPAPVKDGTRTPEREALELAARGDFDDAAREYDVLATAHPDDPAFKEAARILRAKAGRGR